MKLAFSIAFRFLKSGKGQTFMIILGIAIGVSVQVFIGSLITGLQKSLVDKTIGSSSQITITSSLDNTLLSNYQADMSRIEAVSDQITIVSPVLNQPGTLVNGSLNAPTLARAFDFNKANQIYHFDEKIIEGNMPSTMNEVALGANLKTELNINVGDTIVYQIPLVGEVSYTVVGFFDFNVKAINDAWLITTLPTLQNALSVGDEVSAIELQLKDVFQADTVSVLIENIVVDESLSVDNWINQNAELLSGLQGQSTSSYMIQVFVMISVVLGISSVLAITVLQKSKQIGILKAMGIKDADASLVFLFEGFILGIGGAILGVLFGLGLAFTFTTFALGADGNPVVPLYIDYGFIALSAFIALLASTVAALIPARKSSKLSVIEVIRNA
ncbi:MAG: ABC transporter permease [Candidatus Izemoplasmatales bacterium]